MSSSEVFSAVLGFLGGGSVVGGIAYFRAPKADKDRNDLERQKHLAEQDAPQRKRNIALLEEGIAALQDALQLTTHYLQVSSAQRFADDAIRVITTLNTIALRLGNSPLLRPESRVIMVKAATQLNNSTVVLGEDFLAGLSESPRVEEMRMRTAKMLIAATSALEEDLSAL